MDRKIEPVKPNVVLEELHHWESRREQAERQVAYCQERVERCQEILKYTNVIYVADEVWQDGK